MKIYVAGATGRVATELIKKLNEFGHFVYAGARNPEKIANEENILPVKFDLHEDEKTLEEKFPDDVEAVYFVAGSRGKDLLQTDAFGAVKLMNVAQQKNIKRFILLSSVFATNPEKWTDPALINITDYNIAKFFADMWLIKNTELDYTIIQPGNLMEGKGSGKINTNVPKSAPNSIENVAAVLAEVLERKNTYKKIITMSDGITEIGEALDKIF